MVIYPPEPCDPEAMSVNILNSNTFKLVTIYNVTGQKVLVSEEESVNISNLDNGIYIIKVDMQNGEILTKKIIK